MRLKGLEGIQKVYFIGIGGISMSALAKFLAVNGYAVSGSDAVRGEETEKLSAYGIRTYIGVEGSRKELLEADAVVYTDAISPQNEERITASKMGKRLLPRADLLKIVGGNFANVIAIAGSHGKTTCSSMCAHALQAVNAPFTAHIGGVDSDFGNFYTSGREYFLTEVCEYKRNLLKISADVAVVLNIDKDHMECYQNEEDLISCFRKYAESAKTAFVCADDIGCQKLGGRFSTFGIRNACVDYRAVDLRNVNGAYSFTVEEYGKPLCRIRLQARGICNVYNALGAFSATRSFGFDEKQIKEGLETFKAVKRRFEKIGQYQGADVICDYAHHPREISATVAMAESCAKGRLFVVFQPHTYSRTKLLLNEFVEALRPIKELMIYKTFPAREKYDGEGSAERLAEAVNGLFAENVYVLKTWLKKTVRAGDTVLFLGAGDIYYVAHYLVKELS
ncbi:MAG: UDP-N-acetylmuramate--L-alanine ligase [Clostridiales bacterium]|nr:UDP-N-acetylmuramate--L-alanine ligase [Clostridiales bacterium]